MNILIFNWRDIRHPQAGGGEVYLHELSKRWIGRGCRVDWISSMFAGGQREDCIDGVEIHRVGGRYSIYLRAAFKYCRMPKADVVIDAENGVPFFTPLYSKIPKLLLIHHIHRDVWRRELKWPLANIGAFLELKAMPPVYRKCPVLTVSNSSRDMIRELLPKNTISIVNNAVAENFYPGRKSAVPEIVFLGRLKRYKSIDILLSALEKIRDKEIVLNIIGRGDDEARLRSLANRLELKNVNFTGYLSEEEKRAYLQRAWILVNPSVMEGWGIINIEANACGTPVIGSNVPGIRDSIRNNESGLLFEYGRADELAEKIVYLMENSDELRRLSEGALKWAGNFSWDASADKVYSILESMIENKNGPSVLGCGR